MHGGSGSLCITQASMAVYVRLFPPQCLVPAVCVWKSAGNGYLEECRQWCCHLCIWPPCMAMHQTVMYC